MNGSYNYYVYELGGLRRLEKMVPLFENYEQQYSVLSADITCQIGLLSTSGSKDRRQLISNIEKNVEEAQELLEQMELEIREIETAKRQRCRSKLDCYRAELKRLTLEYIKARSLKQVNYESAEESFDDIRISNNDEQQQRLLNNSESIERSGKRLQEGYTVLVETEDIGAQVLQDLNEQREQIQRSRSRMRATNEDLSRSSKLMSSMIFRSIQQRIVIFIVCVCFIIAISLGLYLGFTK